MTNRKFDRLFGGPPRQPESTITQREMDLAASVQNVLEIIILRLARTVRNTTEEEYLCLAGGVALNCVVNGHLLREKLFKDIWIQPAAGDSGGALGAAFAAWHQYHERPRPPVTQDKMQGAYLGPHYSEHEIQQYLETVGSPYKQLGDDQLCETVSTILAEGKVVGWFHGRMEFGPRALGNRSILGDPRSPSMQSIMNQKIKYRESFRPFAPSILVERVSDYFQLDCQSPYMLIVAPIQDSLKIPISSSQEERSGFDRLKTLRSQLPAITHVDYSARVQTVHPETNLRYHQLLRAFERETGCGVLINTSFNVRGEPIVCTPEDAYRCFMRTEMDYLVLENFLISKSEQSTIEGDKLYQGKFELD